MRDRGGVRESKRERERTFFTAVFLIGKGHQEWGMH